MSAKIDIKQSSQIRLDKNGYSIERVAIVSDVIGAIYAVLKNAIDDGALPKYGDAHPAITGITLNNLTCTPVGGKKYKVVMHYYKDSSNLVGQANAKVTISAGTASEQIIEGIPISGGLPKPFSTLFNGTPSNGSGGVYTGKIWSDVTVDRPRLNLDFEYRSATLPKADIDLYLGKINSLAWLGYAAKTIMCTAIDVNEAGSDYQVRYSFAYNKDTWDFIGQVTGVELPLSPHHLTPDADLDLTKGQKIFKVYDYVDFNALGFVI